LQAANPGTAVIAVGDFNAFQFNDGYTDPIAILLGAPTPDDQLVVDGSPDLVEPDFVNLTTTLPADEQYSFIFDGTPQALDHVLVNGVARSYVTRYAIARGNADFPEQPASLFVNDPTRPERSSDHDMPVAHLRFPPPAADLAVTVAAPETVAAGQPITFTFTVQNAGPSPAQGVAFTSLLPAHTTLTSCTASGGATCGGTPSAPAVSVGTLAPGAIETVTLVATVACSVPPGFTLASSAAVSAITADPYTQNNSTTAAVLASNAPPAIGGVSASHAALLLPLHQMVPVTVTYTASDGCGAVTTALSVTSDEPVTGPLTVQGLAGLTTPDWQVVDANQVLLRAERSLRGDGRVYTITITATDAAGQATTVNVPVIVPRFILPWMLEMVD
jgi:uncharacterized repeat protein (TIGR01451 family)